MEHACVHAPAARPVSILAQMQSYSLCALRLEPARFPPARRDTVARAPRWRARSILARTCACAHAHNNNWCVCTHLPAPSCQAPCSEHCFSCVCCIPSAMATAREPGSRERRVGALRLWCPPSPVLARTQSRGRTRKRGCCCMHVHVHVRVCARSFPSAYCWDPSSGITVYGLRSVKVKAPTV